MLKAALLLLVTALASWPLCAPNADPAMLWKQPFKPFRVIGNIYFVGSTNVSVFLIVTPAGSFLYEGGFKENAGQVVQSITELGFRITDVKYLLGSHLHYDHAGALAELKQRSGAAMVTSVADKHWYETGNVDVPAVSVDRVIEDGEVLRLGDTALTAHLTPGHTQGCTTFTLTTTEEGRVYRVILYCGTSVVAPLVNNERYPHIVEDYVHSFKLLRTLKSDVFLAEHPYYFDMAGKRRRLRPGVPNPFVDPTELDRFIDESEQSFRRELEWQQQAPR